MSIPTPSAPAPASPATAGATAGVRRGLSLRKPIPYWQSILLALACLASVFVAWTVVTWGETGEERIVGSTTLPSPKETFSQLHNLYFEFELTRNIVVTLRRVALGFLLALVVGVPLGVLAGCFRRVGAFLSPLVMFGRNIPLAAVLPLLIFIVPGGEERKVAFIFVACVAFVLADTERAIRDVAQRYVDTAYTLGATRWQTIIKVLVPLAAPAVFGSARLLFGLAFGYIMLAESIKYADDVGGLGYQIQIFQRRGLREHIYLIILIIPVVAMLVDQFLFWMQRSLFPYQYGGPGLLNIALRGVLHAWDDLKRAVVGGRRGVTSAPAKTSESPAVTAANPDAGAAK
jgi:ABC-type nitrate/sulfonate/bicarbonate transport system permease component